MEGSEEIKGDEKASEQNRDSTSGPQVLEFGQNALSTADLRDLFMGLINLVISDTRRKVEAKYKHIIDDLRSEIRTIKSQIGR